MIFPYFHLKRFYAQLIKKNTDGQMHGQWVTLFNKLQLTFIQEVCIIIQVQSLK